MLYSYVCDTCGAKLELLRVIAKRDNPVNCPKCATKDDVEGQLRTGGVLAPMRREISVPTVHYKGAGWTRRPPIMSDPIAAGHPGQRTNWGVDSVADYGDPNVSTPYKTVIGGDVDGLASNQTVGDGGDA